MRITMEPGSAVVPMDGTSARIWTGWTDGGLPVSVWVLAVRTPDLDRNGFEPAMVDLEIDREIAMEGAPCPST